MASAKTSARTEELVKRTIEYLRQKVRVDQTVLFGSHARGDPDEWSDVDLAVAGSSPHGHACRDAVTLSGNPVPVSRRWRSVQSRRA